MLFVVRLKSGAYLGSLLLSAKQDPPPGRKFIYDPSDKPENAWQCQDEDFATKVAALVEGTTERGELGPPPGQPPGMIAPIWYPR